MIAMTDDILLFTKQRCRNCEYVKSKVPEGLELRILDIESVEGTAEAAYHEVIDMHAPILIVEGAVVRGTINIKNKLAEIASRR